MFPFIFALLFLQQEAEKSIRFYQHLSNGNEDDKLLQIEMNKLEYAINGASIEKSMKNSLKLSEFRTKQVRRAVMIGIVLTILREFSGCGPMLQYTATIFKDAGSKLPPNVPAMILTVIQAVGSCFAMSLVDRTGRKVRTTWNFFFGYAFQ